ncbi:hypothetical protein [Aeromicrobium sp. A1-2]|uniref:hypothetical protein n=1 Tax=Aeromicrobium sp. A1-2 TaxID=2107713 RepID=UPI0013C2FD49|nr:hypothetical protein [Aeromicrobium sp. A1-2]
MRTLWDRLIGSPRALAAAVAGLVLVAATVVMVVAASGGPDATAAAAAAPTPESSAESPGADPTEKASKAVPEVIPPDKDVYCPAFAQIQSGGLTTPGDNDEDGVDLAELSATFDGLITRYSKAERVAPLSLRDEYAQALGYLRQGKKATTSKDVELLKALVVNLESLNDSMDTIQGKSAQFCG